MVLRILQPPATFYQPSTRVRSLRATRNVLSRVTQFKVAECSWFGDTSIGVARSVDRLLGTPHFLGLYVARILEYKVRPLGMSVRSSLDDLGAAKTAIVKSGVRQLLIPSDYGSILKQIIGTLELDDCFVVSLSHLLVDDGRNPVDDGTESDPVHTRR